jgi:hypothetical protein
MHLDVADIVIAVTRTSSNLVLSSSTSRDADAERGGQ